MDYNNINYGLGMRVVGRRFRNTENVTQGICFDLARANVYVVYNNALLRITCYSGSRIVKDSSLE